MSANKKVGLWAFGFVALTCLAFLLDSLFPMTGPIVLLVIFFVSIYAVLKGISDVTRY